MLSANRISGCVSVCFLHFARSNFSGAQKNLLRLFRNLEETRVRPVLVAQEEDGLTERARSEGVQTHIVPMDAALAVQDRRLLLPGNWVNRQFVRAVTKYNRMLLGYLKSDRPDVVWCENIRMFVTAFPALRLTGLPAIWNVWSEPHGWGARILHAWGLCTAQQVHLEYKAQGWTLWGPIYACERLRRKAVPLYTGVTDFDEASEQDPRSLLGLGGRTVYLMASNITPGKGQKDLVEAMIEVLSIEPESVLLLAGAPISGHMASEEYYQHLKGLVAAQGAGQAIRLLGWRQDIADLLRACDVYVTSSYTESMPDAVREAMRAGKPVIATDVGGTRELVTPECGYLFPAGDRARLRDLMIRLGKDRCLREKLGQAGKHRIETHFSNRAYAEQFANAVTQIFGGDSENGWRP